MSIFESSNCRTSTPPAYVCVSVSVLHGSKCCTRICLSASFQTTLNGGIACSVNRSPPRLTICRDSLKRISRGESNLKSLGISLSALNSSLCVYSSAHAVFSFSCTIVPLCLSFSPRLSLSLYRKLGRNAHCQPRRGKS